MMNPIRWWAEFWTIILSCPTRSSGGLHCHLPLYHKGWHRTADWAWTGPGGLGGMR